MGVRAMTTPSDLFGRGPLEPSGSGATIERVQADGCVVVTEDYLGRKPTSEDVATAIVAIERDISRTGEVSRTRLEIQSGDMAVAELELMYAPGALDAIIEALMELREHPMGQRMLRELEPGADG